VHFRRFVEKGLEVCFSLNLLIKAVFIITRQPTDDRIDICFCSVFAIGFCTYIG